MEYPFKDLMPLDEVLEREGYYKDWTHLDAKTFYSIVQISEMIKTKGYGTDVRLLISQLAEHFGLSVVEVTDTANKLIARQDAVENLNYQVIKEMTDKDVISAPEIIEARKGENKLSTRLDKEHNEINSQLAQITYEKIDEVIQDGSIVSFKGNGAILGSFDLSITANASLVQGYIDSLVSDGSIDGVTLATDSVTENHIKGLETTVEQINNTVKTFSENNSGVPFSIVDSEGKTALEVNENGTVSTLLNTDNEEFKTYDDNGGVNMSIKTDDDHYEFSIADKFGKIILGVTPEGKLQVPEFELRTHNENGNINSTVNLVEDLNYEFSLVDGNGFVIMALDENGKLNVPSIKTKDIEVEGQMTKNDKVINGDFDSEINMFIAYGQSWAQGYDAPPISEVQEYDSLMLNTGVINNGSVENLEVTATSFVPLIEELGHHNTDGTGQIVGETPTYGQTAMVKQLMKDENNIGINDVSYQLLGTSPGRGSSTLEQLAKGTVYYTRLIEQVQVAHDIAQSMNKSLKVQAFSWTQGHSSGIYHEQLEQLRLDIDADVKAITGQTKDVTCITWQYFPTGDGTADTYYNRYVGASELYPNIVCSGAFYHLDHVTEGVNLHFTGESSAWLGAYHGLAYKRTLIDKEKFIPLKPVSFEYSGNVLYAKFNVPQPPLKFDTERVTLAENYGFSIRDSIGNDKVITSIDIINLDTVKFVLSEPLESTDFLWYGDNKDGDRWGRTIGKRGNLRDSQGDYIVYDSNGLKLPMHNWSVVFKKQIG